jgi:hypothetical protein
MNEWTKEIDVVLEQKKCENDIIETGNHNRNIYLKWFPILLITSISEEDINKCEKNLWHRQPHPTQT